MARFLRWATALVAASGLICGTASAGQIVYVSNSGSCALSAGSDTGAGAHVLATADQVPGMGLISGATVQPNGTQVAFAAQWSGALAEVAKWPGVIQCGVYCVGAYKLVGGTATRLSPAPLSCGDHPCVEYEEAPEIATDGTVYVDYDFSQYTKTGGCSNWCYLTTMRRTTAYPADGSAPYHPALGCSDEDQFAEKYVAVDPRNSKRLLYANCADAQNGNFVLADSLGTLTTAADDAFLSEDDAAFAYPSFAPDGHAIAVILTGDDDEGLWTSSDNGAHWTERLALPDG